MTRLPRHAAEAKRIALDVDIDPFAGLVNADAARLQQVFWNLLTNAVEFTEPGGRVAATLRRAGDDIDVSVVDNGVGIASDFLPFVFEPFRQGDVRLSRGHGGLGLGLAISKQIVELHGGTISAASDGPGLGATLLVRLPARRESGEHLPPTTLPEESAASGVTGEWTSLEGVDILVVDDDEDTLMLFRDSLEREAARVAPPHPAPRRSARTTSIQPTFSCRTSACPGWTASSCCRRSGRRILTSPPSR